MPTGLYGIEGIPLITRFKTLEAILPSVPPSIGIEGIPLITRFKTELVIKYWSNGVRVLKAFHL